MNDQYFRELKRNLRCTRKTRGRLLKRFTGYWRSALDNTADYDQTVALLGPPAEMAQTLMEEVSGEERSAYHRNRVIQKAVAVILAVALGLFSAYALFIKEMTVVEYKEVLTTGAEYESTSESEGIS